MDKPRVFVSSVMENFTQHREATRLGIKESGGEPILVEDFPSLMVSSRTACLDGVASYTVSQTDHVENLYAVKELMLLKRIDEIQKRCEEHEFKLRRSIGTNVDDGS